MNLTLFFRLILMSIFQAAGNKNYSGKDLSYDNAFFYCPCVVAMDGFTVSLQIHRGNYCSSENGYRTFGHTMEEIEFGFPSMNEPLMFQHSEMWDNNAEDFDVTCTVGRIPVSVMEEVFAKHGGIDWNATISVEQFNRLVKI